MTFPDNVAQIFAALLDAAAKGALGLMVGKDPATGETQYLIGAVGDELTTDFLKNVGTVRRHLRRLTGYG